MGDSHAYIWQDLSTYIEQEALQHQLSCTPRLDQSLMLARYMISCFLCQLVALDRHGQVIAQRPVNKVNMAHRSDRSMFEAVHTCGQATMTAIQS